MSDNEKTKSKLMESIRLTKAGKNKKEDVAATPVSTDAKPAEPAKAEKKAAPKKAAPKPKAKAPAKKSTASFTSRRVWPD